MTNCRQCRHYLPAARPENDHCKRNDAPVQIARSQPRFMGWCGPDGVLFEEGEFEYNFEAEPVKAYSWS